ncbi:hypothetical protein [Streptosporangium sp. NPDC048865]|uniref:hypothetical protein n=1 Tax=Streptosporangium sp. NPDC048865 TaxID=3155766 RepID=UPI0034248EEB
MTRVAARRSHGAGLTTRCGSPIANYLTKRPEGGALVTGKFVLEVPEDTGRDRRSAVTVELMLGPRNPGSRS